MIVVDASAIVDVLLEQPPNEALTARLHSADELHAPHLLDVEVLSVLRRLCATGALSVDATCLALQNFDRFPITRYPHVPLRDRIWELRNTVSAYDGSYVALAEALDLPLATSDGRLTRSHGHGARIESYAR